MSKTVRKNHWIRPVFRICTKSQWGLFWSESRPPAPPAKFCGSPFCSFSVILLTNQPTNQPTEMDKVELRKESDSCVCVTMVAWSEGFEKYFTIKLWIKCKKDRNKRTKQHAEWCSAHEVSTRPSALCWDWFRLSLMSPSASRRIWHFDIHTHTHTHTHILHTNRGPCYTPTALF